MSAGIHRQKATERRASNNTAARASLPILTLDEVSSARISGWAFDTSDPDRHVRLSIYNGSEHLISFYASTFREDLLGAGLGNGQHGFQLVIPPHIADRLILDLRIIDEDTNSELAIISVSNTDERFGALRDALLSNLPHFLESVQSPEEKLRWSQLYLSVLMSATVRTFLETRSLIENIAAARRALTTGEPLAPPEALPFDRVVDSVIGRYPILILPFHETPKVSVVIPVYNKFEFTYDCVKALLETQNAASFEVIIVDDQSSDETLLAPVVFPGATVLRNDRNLGFVGGCNRGAAAAKGEYIFFLNNDTKVHDFSLDALLDVFRLHENVGIAGSKLLFGDGKLQEAGGIIWIWRFGDGWNYGRGQDPADPRFNYVRDTDYVSGAALMISKVLCDEISGFNPDLAPGYYEDTDMAFRVRSMGYRTLYQPRSVVTHFEGVSSGNDLTQGMKRYQLINGRKFFMRWKHVLADHALNGIEPEKEKERNARLRVLFVDATTPTPNEDAGSNAAMTHMRALQALGAKVTFVPSDNMTHLGKISSELQDLGIEFLHHPWFWSVEEVLRKRANDFDVIYLHRFDVASRYLTTCRAFAPRARILYNVADIHFLRLERERTVGAAGAKSEAEVSAIRSLELNCIRGADHVIVHSEVEASLLTKESVNHVSVIPWVMRGKPGPVPLPERGLVVGFIGGFGHSPNADAVIWFVEGIWPLIRAKVPDATFLIFGSKMPSTIRNLGSVPGVTAVGFVDHVADAFDRMRVSVAPLRYGAGLKGKVGESLAHGVPCVGTSVAYEGFGTAFGKDCVADDVTGIAQKDCHLLTDNRALEHAGKMSLQYSAAHLSEQIVKAKISAIISG